MSSRSSRRSRRGGTRSRRTPARPAKGDGLRIPWRPLLAVLAVGVVVAAVAYLLWQQNQPASSSDEFAEMEADPAPDLPGEFVDLQTIYDGAYGTHGENKTATHVTRDVDYTESASDDVQNSNPPTGGPHWARGSCPEEPKDAPPFCGPAPWGIFRTAWEPEVVVHNMEHGGVVLWYNTTDQTVIDELEELIKGRLADGDLLVMTPYPDMEAETIAITAWTRIDKFPVGEYTKERVNTFIDAFACRFNPEGFSGRGC